jgi:hypothetical protein
MHSTTNVISYNQYNRLIESLKIVGYQQGEASTPQQQGFEPIGEILKRLPLIPGQG